MALPRPFTTASALIPTFNYEDIIDGSGILELYLTAFETSTTLGTPDLEYNLTSKNNRSDTDSVAHSGESGNTTYNFDSRPFNTLRRAKGVADFYLLISVTGGDNDTALTGDVTVGLYHYDGSTETQLGSSVVKRMLSGVQTTEYHVFSGRIDIDTAKAFRRGDMLRLKINLKNSGVDEGLTDNLTTCYCDPANFTAVDEGNTNSSLRVPFLIEL